MSSCDTALVELALLRDLGEQLGDLALEIRLDVAEALRLAAERALRVQIGVVVDLDEGLERDAEPPAVIEQRVVVIGDAPRAGIEIEALVELAGLLAPPSSVKLSPPRSVQLRPPARG